MQNAMKQSLGQQMRSEEAQRMFDAVMMQQRMGPVLQKVMQLTKEEVEKERAKSGKKP